MSVPAFVKSKAQGAKLVTPKIDRPGAVEIAKQLRAIGNNVNQMARATNAAELDPDSAANLTAELQNVKKELERVPTPKYLIYKCMFTKSLIFILIKRIVIFQCLFANERLQHPNVFI